MGIFKLFNQIQQETYSCLNEINQKKELFSKSINLLKKIKKNKKKVIIFGNGGSAATSSHFAVDLTKNARTRCINFNDADLITCFSNDYGFQNFVRQSIDSYYDKDDLVILISVSGESKNIVNAAKFCVEKKINLITLTGKNKNNSLKKLNKKGISFHINSSSYNTVEIIHSYILLTLVDLMVGKATYGTKIGKI
jgi:D-sedoheptulose 7-phosphate isomerase